MMMIITKLSEIILSIQILFLQAAECEQHRRLSMEGSGVSGSGRISAKLLPTIQSCYTHTLVVSCCGNIVIIFFRKKLKFQQYIQKHRKTSSGINFVRNISVLFFTRISHAKSINLTVHMQPLPLDQSA
jgi:hypothetical protein